MPDPKRLTDEELASIRKTCPGETVQRLLGHIAAEKQAREQAERDRLREAQEGETP